MSTQINNNLYVAAPKALDSRWGIFEAGVWRPYSSVNEALTIVEDGLRHKTMVLAITTPGGIVDYWFKDGTENIHLVRKDYDKIRNEIVVDGISLGDAVDGTVFPEGTTQEEILRTILSRTINPTFTAPSLSVVRSLAYLLKIGQTLSLQLTANFNRGYIFQPWDNVTQGFRSGAATNYTFVGQDGLNASGVSSTVTHNITIVRGVSTFDIGVDYGVGPQPINNKEQNFSIPLVGGSLSMNTSIEGVYPIFGTISSIVAQDEFPLYSMITANNIEFTLFAESGGNKQTFWMPKDWHLARPITKIENFNIVANVFDTINRLSQWALTEETIGGIVYIRYRYTGSTRGQLKIKIIF